MVNIPPFIQWAILILILFLIFGRILRFLFGKKNLGQAAQQDVKGIETEGGKEKKIMDAIKGSSNKQRQRELAKQLERETDVKRTREKKLEEDLKKAA